MKKIILSIALITSCYFANAQFEAGITGGYGTTWLLNKSVSDSPDIDYKPSFSGYIGLQGAYYFNQVGVGIELNFATIKQGYEGQDNSDFTATERVKFTEIPLLLKFKSEGGFYFEVGPKFSFTGKATQDMDVPGAKYEDLDIKDGVNSSIISGLIGFGGRFNLAEHLDLSVGLRITGNFTNLNKEFSRTEASSKELGISCVYGNFEDGNIATGNQNYVKTWVLDGSLHAGLTYTLGGGSK